MTTAVSRLPGSCIGGSLGPPVAAPGRQAVQGQLGTLAGQRWREDLLAVAALRGAAGQPLPGPHHGHRAALVQAQELGERQLEPCGDP